MTADPTRPGSGDPPPDPTGAEAPAVPAAPSQSTPDSAAREGRLERLRHKAVSLQHSSTARIGAARQHHSSVDFVLATGERDRILGGSLVAGALAFRLFLLLVPAMVVVVGVVGLIRDTTSYSSEELVDKIGMVGYIADSVADASKLSTGSAWTVLIVALWILFLTSRSFARALRTAHALAWGLPIRRWPKGGKAGLAVIGFLFVLLALAALVNSMRTDSILSTIGVAMLTGIVASGCWMVASRFLPRAGDRWLDLLPGALFVGFGMQLVNLGVIYFTWRAGRAEAFYGPMGLAIVVLAWTYVVGRLLIASAVVNSQRYTRRTGITAVPTVLTATDDAVAGVDAGARLAGAQTAALAASPAAGGAAATLVASSSDTEEPAMSAEKATEESPAEENGEAKAAEGGTVTRFCDECGRELPADGRFCTACGADVAAEIVDKGIVPPEPPGGKPKRPKKPGRGRRITALLLVILAAIVSIIMMVSVWAHDFLLSTNTFVTIVAPVLKDPQVTENMGNVVAQRTIELTDAEERLKEVLPPRLQFIAAPIVGQVEQQLARATTRLLRSEKGYAAWERILTFTHQSVVAVLKDESTYISIYGDQIRLDLLPLVVAAVNRLNDLLPDVIEQRAPLPEFTADQTPEEQRAELAQALGKPVSEDFAQVVLFEGDQVGTAQQTLKLFELLVYVLIALTAVLVIAAIVVSPRRLRTLIHLGMAAVLAVIITRVAVNQVQDAIVGAASGAGAPVIRASVTAVFASLQNLIIWGLVAGVIVGVLAYLATRPRWLTRLAARVVVWGKAAGTWGKAAGGQAAEHRDPVLDWIRAHRDGLLIGITVVAVVLLLVFTSSLGGAIAIIVVAALLGGGVYWVGRTPPGSGSPTGGEGDEAPPGAGPPTHDVTAPAGDLAVATGGPPAKKPAPRKRKPPAPKQGTAT